MPTEKKALPRQVTHWYLNFGIARFHTVRHKCLLCMSHSTCDMPRGLQLKRQQMSRCVSCPCVCIPSSPVTIWPPEFALLPHHLLPCSLKAINASLFIYPVAGSLLSPFLLTWVKILITFICSFLLTGISNSTSQLFS